MTTEHQEIVTRVLAAIEPLNETDRCRLLTCILGAEIIDQQSPHGELEEVIRYLRDMVASDMRAEGDEHYGD